MSNISEHAEGEEDVSTSLEGAEELLTIRKKCSKNAPGKAQ
jgi:hypothetical protein